MSVTLCMIVRNEAANLPACLEAAPLFEEVLIVDTGSTDATVKIARHHGARVLRFPWCDDFSAARNYGLDRVTTDHVFRLDADDRIDRGQWKKLARLFGALAGPMACAFRVYSRQHTGDTIACDELRLWPNRPQIRFHGKVHERIRLEEDAPEVAVGFSDVRIDHGGYEDEATYRGKLERNLAILEREAALPGCDPLVRFDLGRTLGDVGRYDEAIDHLRAFNGMKTDRLHSQAGRLAWRRLVEIHCRRGNEQAALLTCQHGLREYPDDQVMVGAAAAIMASIGATDLAREGFEQALKLCGHKRMDSGIPTDFAERIRGSLAALETKKPL